MLYEGMLVVSEITSSKLHPSVRACLGANRFLTARAVYFIDWLIDWLIAINRFRCVDGLTLPPNKPCVLRIEKTGMVREAIFFSSLKESLYQYQRRSSILASPKWISYYHYFFLKFQCVCARRQMKGCDGWLVDAFRYFKGVFCPLRLDRGKHAPHALCCRADPQSPATRNQNRELKAPADVLCATPFSRRFAFSSDSDRSVKSATGLSFCGYRRKRRGTCDKRRNQSYEQQNEYCLNLGGFHYYYHQITIRLWQMPYRIVWQT